jgi:hypothetical protein
MYIPAPFLRITTCGLLTIEVVEEVVSTEPPLAQYTSLTPEQLRGRGTAPALTLLKLLLSCPERFALKDWLMNQFCRDRELFSNVRLDNIASQLRSLVCPSAYEGLRKHLVTLVRSSPVSGDGYQLAAYPLIWTDIDALTKNAEQAARMERFGDDPLPFWERVYALVKRGVYLPDEVYSDWSAIRRGEISGVLRQSVQALARLYLLRHGKSGEEEALLLLRSYWLEHPREEDVLRPLMELLGQRECYQEALDHFQHLQALLEEENQQPDPRTLDIVAFLRAKQIQRTNANEAAVSVTMWAEQHSSPVKADPLSQNIFHSHISAVRQPLEPNMCIPAPTAYVQMLPLELDSEDTATWFGVRLAHIFNFIHQWSKQAMSCDILQMLIDREIAMFDDIRETSESKAFTLSRRQALITLASLPTMLTSLVQTQSFLLLPEEFLPQCAASITACWHLLRGKEFLLAEKLLARYLPTLADLAHQSKSYQSTAANLASQGYRLMGILALHRNNPQARTAYWEQAVHFAEITGTPNVLAAALISLAYHDNDPEKALTLYQRGMSFKQDLSPLILTRLYARLAVTSAQLVQEAEALEYLRLAREHYPASPEKDLAFLYAEFVPASLTMEKGLTYLTLAHHIHPRRYAQQAWETFAEETDNSQIQASAPTRTHYEIINHQAATTLVLNDLEAFCERLEQGIHGARLLQSGQRRQETILLYKKARQLWPNEARIHSLADLLLETEKVEKNR